SYTDAQVAGLDENTLNLYMWYLGAWHIGANPGRNTFSNEVWGDFDVTKLTGAPGGVGGNPPPVGPPIPTLNEWGIIIFLILLAGVSVMMLRRRKSGVSAH
ncbi:MAG TPA: IPTL-CTERM sorting domain-containing protein, partial [bacterium]|nr:IPTL-CTERM sorting domain-containing protein [bacterium]